MILTDKFEETIEFYVRILGFTCAEKNNDWGWARVRREEVSFMIATPIDQDDFERPKFTGSFYIFTEAVDALWIQLKDQVRVCYPIENMEYGMREFGIYDNNGYLLQFGKGIE